jgi:hypothetical protein
LPFEGDTPMATALQHVNVPLPMPRQVNPNLPPGVELVLIKALAKDPALRFESVAAMNQAFQEALATALDPKARAAAEGKTVDANRTLAMYRKYQNVRPPNRRRQMERSALLATLLLLLACTVSAGAVAIIRPEIFTGAAAAPGINPADVQGTVDARLATALAGGTTVPTGSLETEIYATVLVAVEASRIAAGGPSSTPSSTPTPSATGPGVVVLPSATPTPSPTRTLRPGETPPTATRTPPPSATGAATSTGMATATSSGVPPTNTSQPPTNTSQPPTDTSQPPTNTSQPPTDTPQPPTPTTASGCAPGGANWPECRKQTQTAQAG